jgi:hypothetical protein
MTVCLILTYLFDDLGLDVEHGVLMDGPSGGALAFLC